MKKPNKSLILTILSILGLGTTTVLAVRSGMKTKETLSQHPEAEDIKTKVSLVWKSYIATIIAMIATGTCMVTAHTLDAKQIAALSGIVATGATTLSKYRSKVSEVIGQEEEKKIFEAVRAEDRMMCFPEILDTSEYEDDTLFYDTLSDRYFYSNMPSVLTAICYLERSLQMEYSVSVNDWLGYLGLERDNAFDDTCWCIDYMMNWFETDWINVVIVDKNRSDGTPYKIIYFDEPPITPEELKEKDEHLYKQIFG